MKKCSDKIASLEKDVEVTEAKLEELKVSSCREREGGREGGREGLHVLYIYIYF